MLQKMSDDNSSLGEVVPGQAGGSNKCVYQNPELEAMAKEIQELLQERLALQREVQEQEYIISANSTETHSLQVLIEHVASGRSLDYGSGPWGRLSPQL